MKNRLAPYRIGVMVFILTLTGFKTLSGLELTPFQNERLEFDLMYRGMKSASSEMWLETSDSLTTLFWTVKSKAWGNYFFKIDNTYQVTIDKNGSLLQATKSIDQKNIQQHWSINYDWDLTKAVSNQNYEWPVLNGCFNILSMLYDLRTRPLTPNDSIAYILDVESQVWQLTGVVKSIEENDGTLTGHEIVFNFSPAMQIFPRIWKTDLLTNRLAREQSTLVIRLGLPPQQRPLLLRFGGEGGTVEMRLKQ